MSDPVVIFPDEPSIHTPTRRKLPRDRPSIAHTFKINSFDGRLIVGLFEDGQPGEIFLRLAQVGSVLDGLCDAIGVSSSLALQYGCPIKIIVDKWKGTRFEPDGVTDNEQIRMVTSVLDYVARYLEQKFIIPKLKEIEECHGNGTST